MAIRTTIRMTKPQLRTKLRLKKKKKQLREKTATACRF